MIGTVHNLDAVALLQRIMKRGIRPDLIFVDPPFNIGRKYAGYVDKLPQGQFEDFICALCHHAIRAVKPDGVFAIHCPDDIAAMVLQLECHESLDVSRRVAWINWYYGFGQWGRSGFTQTRCHLLVYSRGKPKFNADDIMIESVRRKIGDPRAEDSADEGMVVPGTVWGIKENDGPGWGRIQGNNHERWCKKNGALVDHDNQLPENYMERVIRTWTDPDDLVVDVCGGSGTTAVVAAALERRWITGDISKESCASIRKRLKKGSVRL